MICCGMKFCSMNGVQQSMSRAGCPYDNSPMERFFNTFKCEYFYNHIFLTPGLSMPVYITMFMTGITGAVPILSTRVEPVVARKNKI